MNAPVTINEIRVFDKASMQTIAALPVDDAAGVASAAKRARAAQPAWAALPVKERVRLLKLARKEMMKDYDKIRDALARETGKAPFDIAGEIFSVCQDIGHYSGKAAKWLKPKKVSMFPLLGKKGMVFYKPYGIVGVISPWNAPLILSLRSICLPIAYGNTTVLKPSTEAAVAGGVMIAEVFHVHIPTAGPVFNELSRIAASVR